jgi:hypothetical protein
MASLEDCALMLAAVLAAVGKLDPLLLPWAFISAIEVATASGENKLETEGDANRCNW